MLEFAFAGNVLFVTPVILLLWFHKDGAGIVFGPHIPISDGLRILVASMWTSIVLVSIAGMKWEIELVGLLVFQIVYKAVFMIAYVAPRAIAGEWEKIPRLLTAIFVLGLICFPPMIIFDNWR
ncbi:MAG: hypothetical protein KDJ62_03770 [Rhodobiaceae bacterium]|nr:hypothetical protein [Rhodobiaceae bacterium]MCC0049851.1 hypothetical protein [Rhodobiaceae bacterium]